MSYSWMTFSALKTMASAADAPAPPGWTCVTVALPVGVGAFVSPTRLRRCTSLAPATAAVCCATSPSLTR